MSAAIQDAQARLNLSLREIVIFFSDDANVPESSVSILNDYIEKHLTSEFLLLAESYGRSMAFIDHDELINRLYSSWTLLLEGYTLERKLTMKRIRILKEDKKADPAALPRQEQILMDTEEKKAKALVQTMRLKVTKLFSIQEFKKGKDFDCMVEYGKVLKHDIDNRIMLNEAKELLAKEREAAAKDKKSRPKASVR